MPFCHSLQEFGKESKSQSPTQQQINRLRDKHRDNQMSFCKRSKMQRCNKHPPPKIGQGSACPTPPRRDKVQADLVGSRISNNPAPAWPDYANLRPLPPTSCDCECERHFSRLTIDCECERHLSRLTLLGAVPGPPGTVIAGRPPLYVRRACFGGSPDLGPHRPLECRFSRLTIARLLPPGSAGSCHRNDRHLSRLTFDSPRPFPGRLTRILRTTNAI